RSTVRTGPAEQSTGPPRKPQGRQSGWPSSWVAPSGTTPYRVESASKRLRRCHAQVVADFRTDWTVRSAFIVGAGAGGPGGGGSAEAVRRGRRRDRIDRARAERAQTRSGELRAADRRAASVQREPRVPRRRRQRALVVA